MDQLKVISIAKATEKKLLGGVTGKGFKPGQSGNPKGRPKNSFSLVDMLRRKLNTQDPQTKKLYAELLISKLVDLAIKDGDSQQIKNILQYMEGMPQIFIKQSGKLTIDTQMTDEELDKKLSEKILSITPDNTIIK